MTDHPASFHSPLRKAVIHVAHELKHATVSREDMANELLDALDDDPGPDLYAALEELVEIVESLVEGTANLNDIDNLTTRPGNEALSKATPK